MVVAGSLRRISAAHVHAVDVGEAEIQQDEVVLAAPASPPARPTGANPVDPVTLILENLPEAATDRVRRPPRSRSALTPPQRVTDGGPDGGWCEK